MSEARPQQQDPLAPLRPAEVRVFHVAVDEDEDPVMGARLKRLLSEDERDRQLRFHFASDRQSYLSAHALTRTVLAALTGAAPHDLQFDVGPHGRPELRARGQAARLRFNLSHTRGRVACAVALEHDVGVDVEQVERRVEIAQLARHVFSERERAALLALPEGPQRERFFRIWTLKESYIKAVGKGLAIPLRSITLGFEATLPPRIEFAPPIDDVAGDWQFRTWWPLPAHMLSVAARCATPLEFSVYELAL